MGAAEAPEVEGYSGLAGTANRFPEAFDSVKVDLAPSESITFTYGEIKVVYTQRKP